MARVLFPVEPEKLVKTEIPEKLPWERDITDGTGIKVKKTDDGVEVTARYFELSPKPVDIDADKKAIAVLEQAARDNLLNDEIEL